MADLHHNPHKIRAMTANMKPSIKNKTGVVDNPEEQIFNQVYLKYCKPDNVRLKHQIVIRFKARFLAHILMLKSKGEKMTMMHKLNCWADQNIDEIYEHHNRNILEKQKLFRSVKGKPMPLVKETASLSLRNIEYFTNHFEKHQIEDA